MCRTDVPRGRELCAAFGNGAALSRMQTPTRAISTKPSTNSLMNSFPPSRFSTSSQIVSEAGFGLAFLRAPKGVENGLVRHCVALPGTDEFCSAVKQVVNGDVPVAAELVISPKAGLIAIGIDQVILCPPHYPV